jgi:hypothetical protein
MLVGAGGRWNPNSINFIFERQRGQVHIKLECSETFIYGDIYLANPLPLGRNSARQLLEAGWVQSQVWKGALLGLWEKRCSKESFKCLQQSELEISAGS